MADIHKPATPLPCPNPWGCGKARQEPVVTHYNFDADSNLKHVVCHNCGLRGPVRQTEAKAIAAWNTRHAANCFPDLVAALEALVEEYVCNVDATRTAGFYVNPESEDCVVEARKALALARAEREGGE